MADDPPRGQPRPDPLQDWPSPPSGAGGPPSAPVPPWAQSRPGRVEPLPRPEVAPPPVPPPPPGRRFGGLRSRRGIVAAVVVAALVLVGAVAAVLVSGGGDGEGADVADGSTRTGRSRAPAAAVGKELPLLDGRLVIVTPEGWEPLESTADLASIRVNLREATGRELLGTLVVTFLAGEGSVDGLLAADGGQRFEVTANGGPVQATTVAPRGQVLAAAARPTGRVFLSLSVFALDGNGLDAALLRKLFTEQVAPQLRFP